MSVSPRLPATRLVVPMLAALALGLAACAAKPMHEQAPAASTPEAASPAHACDAGKVQALVGQPATAAAVARAKQDSGADSVRVTKPGQPATLDYRHDRLNIEVDADNIATVVKCG